MLAEILTQDDVNEFLERFSTAIECDQAYVDGLPLERFSASYSDSIWRTWRHHHRKFIEQLLVTTDAIPPVMLWQLTRIAVGYEPALVENVLLELFAEVVSGSCAEDFGTAERFFGGLIEQMGQHRKGRSSHKGARASILTWLATADPLRIARDPECGYG